MAAPRDMGFGYTQHLYFTLHTARTPSAKEWAEYIEHSGSMAADIKGIFVYTAGGGPNAGQRKAYTGLWETIGRVPPCSVVTPAPMVRHIVTAIEFFMPKAIRAFKPSEVREAFQHLDCSAAAAAVVLDEMERVSRELGIALPADQLRQALGA